MNTPILFCMTIRMDFGTGIAIMLAGGKMDLDVMTQWATDRVNRWREEERKAGSIRRTAERDLFSIKLGRPSRATMMRFADWKACQPSRR